MHVNACAHSCGRAVRILMRKEREMDKPRTLPHVEEVMEEVGGKVDEVGGRVATNLEVVLCGRYSAGLSP